MTLTPVDVHSPGVMGGKKARNFLEAWKRLLLLNKADGLYVGRPLIDDWQLQTWAASHGYTLDDDLHITILYSSVAIPWENRQDNIKAQVIGWEILGPDKAVVLLLSCPECDVRWQNAIKAGAKSAYDTYKPHLTLFYLGADADTSEFLLPDIPRIALWFGPERSADLGQSTANVFKAVTHYPAGTPGGKGGQFAPSGAHGGAFAYHPPGGAAPQLAGPGNVPGAITKYDTHAVVQMRAAAKSMPQTYMLPNRSGIQHAALAASYGTGAAVKGKEAHIILGGPGSGKSTVAEHIAGQRGALVVDADIVKTHIPEYNGGKNAGGVHEESLSITATLLNKARSAGDNIVLPTTGRTKAYADGIADSLIRAGYTVHIHHVDVDVDTAVARTLDRAAATGRFVDPDYTANTVGTNPRTTFNALKNDKRFASATGYDNNGAAPSITSTRGHSGVQGAGPGSGATAVAHPPGGAAAQIGHVAPNPAAPPGAPGHIPVPGPHPSHHVHPTAPVTQRMNAAVIAAPATAQAGAVVIHGTLQATLSGGTSAIPRAFNSAVQQLQSAFQTHAGNPTALHAAINSIKGPPAGHTFGQKFAALKAQALMVAGTAAPPKPPIPTAPVLPSTLPSNKATWNGNTLLRIQQIGSNPNLSPSQMHAALMAISISQHHHPMVKAYHSAMLAHAGSPGVGPNPAPGTTIAPAVATAAAATVRAATPRAHKLPKIPTPQQVLAAAGGHGPATPITQMVWSPRVRRTLRDLHSMARAGNWSGVQGAYIPQSAAGHFAATYQQALLAHQTTHGLQQGQGAAVRVPRPPAATIQAVAPTIHAGSLPAAPPLNPAFAAHAASFQAKVTLLQNAATGPNPIQALNNITVGSAPMKAYHAALVAHVHAAYQPFLAAQAAAANVVAKPRKNKMSSTYAAQAIDTYRAANHPSLDASPIHNLIRDGNQAKIKAYVHTTQQGDHQLAAMYKAQGFDGLPKVVDKVEFDKLVTGGGLEMFRTVKDIPGRSSLKLAQDFMSGDYYAGLGVHGNGTYVAVPAASKGGKLAFGVRSGDAPRKDSAHYAGWGSHGATMFRMVLKPDAKIGTKSVIEASQRSHLQHLANLKRVAHQAGNTAEYKKLDNEEDFHRDLGRHAASLGYDAYSAGRGGRGARGTKNHASQYVILLNRTAVAVRRETEDPRGQPVD